VRVQAEAVVGQRNRLGQGTRSKRRPFHVRQVGRAGQGLRGFRVGRGCRAVLEDRVFLDLQVGRGFLADRADPGHQLVLEVPEGRGRQRLSLHWLRGFRVVQGFQAGLAGRAVLVVRVGQLGRVHHLVQEHRVVHSVQRGPGVLVVRADRAGQRGNVGRRAERGRRAEAELQAVQAVLVDPAVRVVQVDPGVRVGRRDLVGRSLAESGKCIVGADQPDASEHGRQRWRRTGSRGLWLVG
jgi:hypothetical protein